jgi:hypothetical protein
MNDNDPPEDDARQPEEETALDVARREFIRAKWDAGWKYDGNWTIHPEDDEIRFIVDPFTGEVTFSAKYTAMLDADPDAVKYIEAVRQDLDSSDHPRSPSSLNLPAPLTSPVINGNIAP